jgi:tetratricopeptide (TPR) repeat protein
LAESYLIRAVNNAIPNESCREAKADALEAVKKDAEAAAPHAILADVEFSCNWDWSTAVSEIRQAIDLNPNLSQAHSSYGRYLLTMGRTSEGLAETKRAVELDPLSLSIRWDRCVLLYLVGQYDGATEQCRKMQELNPNSDLGFLLCGEVDVEKGNLAEAVRELQEAVTFFQRGRQIEADPAYANRKALHDKEHANPRVGDLAYANRRAVAHLAYAYALAGRRNDAQNLLTALLEMSKQQFVHPVLIARVYAGLGQKQAAFEWLEGAYRVHEEQLLELEYDPSLASLRSDPRFLDLVRRIGLPPR